MILTSVTKLLFVCSCIWVLVLTSKQNCNEERCDEDRPPGALLSGLIGPVEVEAESTAEACEEESTSAHRGARFAAPYDRFQPRVAGLQAPCAAHTELHHLLRQINVLTLTLRDVKLKPIFNDCR